MTDSNTNSENDDDGADQRLASALREQHGYAAHETCFEGTMMATMLEEER